MFKSGLLAYDRNMKCKVRDCEIFYEQIGDGIPLISLHGSPLDSRSMKGCIEPIFRKRKGWCRLYPDLPGHGQTSSRDWIKNSDDMLQVALDLIDKIIPDTRFALAGMSYGGYIAGGIVQHRPEQVAGLLLIVPSIVRHLYERDLPPKRVLARDEELLAELDAQSRAGFENVAVVQTRSHWDRFIKEIVPGLRDGDTQFLERFHPSIDSCSFGIGRKTSTFEKPALILTGRQDHFVGYRDSWTILENYPRATFAVLDRAGHGLHIEQVTLFNALVSEWLDRVEETLG
jgi:pimeloyl-ACP methyl ester carboxylesterase